MASLLEIKQASGSLAVFLQSQEDEHVEVELTNGTRVSGVIEHADAHMNLSLQDAQVTIKPDFAPPKGSKRSHLYAAKGYRKLNLDRFFVVGSRIRYVKISNPIPVAKAVKTLMKRTQKGQSYYQPNKRKPTNPS
eukprot:m.27654 g.27654  ORF g.27654 m.27654 type:complete len:135 (-) comp11769_c0_seq1:83-487(-)